MAQTPDVGIFVDNTTVRYHLELCKKVNPLQWNTYTAQDEFINSKHRQKFAFLFFPYPFETLFHELVLQLTEHCDHVFIVGSELHNVTVDFMLTHDVSNVTYYICGQLNFSLKHAEVREYYDWFETSRYFYRDYLPEILQRLAPGPKDCSFDVLLGRKKHHRDAIYKYVQKNLRVEDCRLSYFNNRNADFSNSGWVWENRGLRLSQAPQWTVDRVEYYGHRMSLSQVIPIEVYNQTNYTVVAETNCSNDYSFYTEKTAKPIIARRLFVMIAGRYYLRNLRKLGFRTFDCVIDESYDEVEDDYVQWEMAGQQMSALVQRDPAEVLAKIRPIVDHNFEVMMTTGWLSGYLQQVEQQLGALVQQT